MVAKRSPLSLPELVGEYLDQYLAEHKDHLPHGVLHDCVVGQVERVLCEKVLEHCEGNQSKTAELLGINRNTLSRKLKGPAVACDLSTKPRRAPAKKPKLKLVSRSVAPLKKSVRKKAA